MKRSSVASKTSKLSSTQVLDRTKSRGKEQSSICEDKYWEPSMIRQESQSVAGLAIKRWTANNSTLSFEES